MIEHEPTDRRISGVFGQRDIILRIQIANAQGGIENNRSIRKRERLFDDVKFIVNLADKLLENVFHRREAQNTSKFVDDHGYRSVLRSKFSQQL